MTSRVFPVLALAAALALAALPLRAQVKVDELVQADMLDGGLTKRGTYMSALRISLSDGWKTYWRAPGDAGIPPQFDWGRSQNLGHMEITWPTPHVFDQNGMQSIGYKTQLVLPVEITPADPTRPVRLRGKVEVGICKDICVPGTLSVDHQLDAKAGRNPAIAAAMAQRPFTRKEGGVTSSTCRLSPVDGGMRLEARIAMPSAGGQEVAVIEPGSPRIWASQTQTRREGGTLLAVSDLFPVSGGPLAVDRSAVRITVLGRRHAVDIRGCTSG
ncbi:protein-disulfide reductase DsbD domain-containing protein [Sedimentitalea todarodis]|uniref:Protein-disulfide reductase DsbD family protein n=1 Tax=Sedimentitalea todarodis TaxID=1631240 RepID=A0ABU3VIZ2_9RHOB|nr:protein-disulfide reductase DsbD domain-containing protein [Sedimentitalea todarodis]MDU9005669.1 protein-disulfide reductase DsbD family protein [Sedimentitalea todarodis]